MKDHNISYLIDALREANIIQAKTVPGARQTIQYWIRTGVLKLRQMPNSRHYRVNEQEVKEIIEALSPNGKGVWHSN